MRTYPHWKKSSYWVVLSLKSDLSISCFACLSLFVFLSLQGLSNVISLDFDYRKELIYWIDTSRPSGRRINRMRLNGSDLKVHLWECARVYVESLQKSPRIVQIDIHKYTLSLGKFDSRHLFILGNLYCVIDGFNGEKADTLASPQQINKSFTFITGISYMKWARFAMTDSAVCVCVCACLSTHFSPSMPLCILLRAENGHSVPALPCWAARARYV